MAERDETVYAEDDDELGSNQRNEPSYSDIRKQQTEEPPRATEVTESSRGKSLVEGEEESQTLSDLKELIKSLMPESPISEINKLAKSVMASRVFPGKYNSKHKSLVVMIMRKHPELDALEVWETTDDMLSIAYKGEGRIDILEGYGVLSESKLGELGTQSFSR